jgi:hypothetical protein
LLADMRKQIDAEGEATNDDKPAAESKVLTNEAGERLHLKVYKLRSAKPDDAREVAETIGDLVEPESWKSGEPYYLRGLSGAVIVRHTAKVHQKIYALLVGLEALDGVGNEGLSGGAPTPRPVEGGGAAPLAEPLPAPDPPEVHDPFSE